MSSKKYDVLGQQPSHYLKPSDGVSAATQLAAHLTGIHSAIKMLNIRIRVPVQYLVAMQKGDIRLTTHYSGGFLSSYEDCQPLCLGKFQDDFLV
ncbi:hypothetical protein MKW94_012186, partial [Papaver nudicaule]|nr:hypothetical protein [Papaver nudicaule]